MFSQRINMENNEQGLFSLTRTNRMWVLREIQNWAKLNPNDDTYKLYERSVALCSFGVGGTLGFACNQYLKRYKPSFRLGFLLPTYIAFFLGVSASSETFHCIFFDRLMKEQSFASQEANRLFYYAKNAGTMTPLTLSPQPSTAPITSLPQPWTPAPGAAPIAPPAAFNHPSIVPSPIVPLPPNAAVAVPPHTLPAPLAPTSITSPVAPSLAPVPVPPPVNNPSGFRTWDEIRYQNYLQQAAYQQLQQQQQLAANVPQAAPHHAPVIAVAPSGSAVQDTVVAAPIQQAQHVPVSVAAPETPVHVTAVVAGHAAQ